MTTYTQGYRDGLEAAARKCDARYMGDNSREDWEARRCAEAIRNLPVPESIQTPPVCEHSRDETIQTVSVEKVALAIMSVTMPGFRKDDTIGEMIGMKHVRKIAKAALAAAGVKVEG